MRRENSSPKSKASTISRRDFVNGLLVASSFGVGAAGASRAIAAASGDICGDVAGNDPRFLRNGNLPAAFNVGHWMRDQRLTFESGVVTVAPGCDAYAGKFEVSDDSGEFDVIIVGAGLAGLSSAFYVLQKRPGTRILLIEANSYAGGNAARDGGPPLPMVASTAGAYCIFPYVEFLSQIYRELAIHWEKYKINSPGDCYFFDENTPGVESGYRGWRPELLLSPDKVERPPFSKKIMDDFTRCAKIFEQWAGKPGGPTDPPDMSNSRYDELSNITLAEYLTNVLRCDPIVADIYSQYTVDSMGGTAHTVNAHSAITFLSLEFANDCFAYPGGNSEIAFRLVEWLKKSDARTGPDHTVDIRLDAIALRVDIDASPSKSNVSVTYFKDEKFRRATGKAMIVATQPSSGRHLIEHISDDERKAAWNEFNTVPALVANLAVRDMTPFVELGLGYSNTFWGSRYWVDFEIADWTLENRNKPDRASVVTFYGGMTVPPEEFPVERLKLLQTPFSDYEKSLRDDLSRVMRGTKFDFDRDVSAIYLYRWGHSMILPTTRSVFGDVRGADGRLDRSKGARHVACRPLGPISFAGQHTEGTPSVESAIGSGHRAAGEVLMHL